MAVSLKELCGLGYRQSYKMVVGRPAVARGLVAQVLWGKGGGVQQLLQKVLVKVSPSLVYMTFDVNPGQVRPENKGNT
jgi:hypothetical protein